MPRHKTYIREDVLEKAMYSFWKSGYKGTSLRALEKDMEINQFSIYDSFSNKKALFVEVLDMYKQHVNTKFLSNLVSPNSSVNDIECFLKEFAHAIQSGKIPNGCLMVNTSTEVDSEEKEIQLILKSYFDTMANLFFNALSNSQQKGIVSSNVDIRMATNYLLGIAQGVTVVAKLQSKKQIEDYIHFAMQKIT